MSPRKQPINLSVSFADSSPIRGAIADGHLRTANGVYFMSLSRRSRIRRDRPRAILIYPIQDSYPDG